MWNGKITFTKIPNYGFHVNITEDLISSSTNYTQKFYNILDLPLNSIPYLDDNDLLYVAPIYINNKCYINTYLRKIEDNSNEKQYNMFTINKSKYSQIFIRFEMSDGNYEISEFDIYPSILLIKSDSNKNALFNNNQLYFKTISYAKYLNEDRKIQLSKICDNCAILIPSELSIAEEDVFDGYHNGMILLLVVYHNYGFTNQFIYRFDGDGNKTIPICTRRIIGNGAVRNWEYNDFVSASDVSDINANISILNEKLTYKPDINFYESINIQSCEYTEGYYFGVQDNNIIQLESDVFCNIFIPIKYKFKYLYTIYDLSPLIFLDIDKNPISYIKKYDDKVFTNEYQDFASITARVYTMPDNLDWDSVKYVALPVNKNFLNPNNPAGYTVFVLTNSLKYVIPSCGYNISDRLEFQGEKIINKIPKYTLNTNEMGNFIVAMDCNFNISKYKNVTNTEEYNWNNRSEFISTFELYLPKGTRVNYLPSSNIHISLRGFDCNGFVYYAESRWTSNNDGWNGFIVPRDFYGSIVCYFGTWNHWNDKFDMNNLSNLERMQFITIQSPEELANNPWKEKHWYAYGTSISDIGLKDTTGNNGHSGKYPLYLDIHSNMIRHNGAIGSGGILNKDANDGRLNVKKNILNTPSDADLVTLEILPNDNYSNLSFLGDIDDTDNSTIMGNLNQCLDYLVNNTHARIVFIFVTSSSAPNNIGSSDPNKPMYDSLSTARKNYRYAVNKIKELAELYGVYCIDADRDLYPYEMRNWGNLFADWIHPSYLGGWVIGKYVWTKLKEIAPMPKFPDIDQTKSTMEWSEYTSPQS